MSKRFPHKRFLRFFACLLLCCAVSGGPARGRAQQISLPPVSITSATGQASWGFPLGISASLSGPDFTLGIGPGGSYPDQHALEDFYHFAAPYPTFNAGAMFLFFSAFADIMSPAEGRITTGGSTYGVNYGFGPFVETLASAPVSPSFAPIIVPAVLTGGASVDACPLSSPDCFSPLYIPVSFDVPGQLTITFAPYTFPGLGSTFEEYTATFTPIPEPSSLALIFAGLTIAAAIRAHRSL